MKDVFKQFAQWRKGFLCILKSHFLLIGVEPEASLTNIHLSHFLFLILRQGLMKLARQNINFLCSSGRSWTHDAPASGIYKQLISITGLFHQNLPSLFPFHWDVKIVYTVCVWFLLIYVQQIKIPLCVWTMNNAFNEELCTFVKFRLLAFFSHALYSNE